MIVGCRLDVQECHKRRTVSCGQHKDTPILQRYAGDAFGTTPRSKVPMCCCSKGTEGPSNAGSVADAWYKPKHKSWALMFVTRLRLGRWKWMQVSVNMKRWVESQRQ